MTNPITVSLNFMPAFYHKHTGVTYGEAYYFAPEYRARVSAVESRFLYDVLGAHGVGDRAWHVRMRILRSGRRGGKASNPRYLVTTRYP